MSNLVVNQGQEQLRAWLDKSKTTQTELAATLEISPEHLSRILAGKYTPSLPLLIKFDDTCGINYRLWDNQ